MENENLTNIEVAEKVAEEVLDDLTLGQKVVSYGITGLLIVGVATTGYGMYKGAKALYDHFKEKKSETSEEIVEEPIHIVEENVESDEETSEE